MTIKFKTPNANQRFVAAEQLITQSWYRYLGGIENLDGRTTTIETLTAAFGPLIIDLDTRLQAVEAEQTVQNNRIDGLEAAVFGGSGGSGEFGDGFGSGFAVS